MPYFLDKNQNTFIPNLDILEEQTFPEKTVVEQQADKEFINGFKYQDAVNLVKNLIPEIIFSILELISPWSSIFSNSNYPTIDEEDYVEIPYDSGTGYKSSLSMFSIKNSRSFSNYASSYGNKIEIDYDVYASDVDKINIEFSDIDSNIYFYYEIKHHCRIPHK